MTSQAHSASPSSDPLGFELLGRRFSIRAADPSLLKSLRALYAPLLRPVERPAIPLALHRLPMGGVRVSLGDEVFEFNEPWIGDAPSSALTHALLATETRHLVFHAAAFVLRGRAVVLAGASGMGKSTLVAHLGSRGAQVLSDEFAPVLRRRRLVAPFGIRMGLREGPRPDLPGVEVELPGERKKLVDPPRDTPVGPLEFPLSAVVILGTHGELEEPSRQSRARLWFDAPPDRVLPGLADWSFRVVSSPSSDGLWWHVDVECPRIREAIHRWRREKPGIAPGPLRVQFEDLDPPDFSAPPALVDMGPGAGVMELSRRLSSAQRSRLVDGEFAGDSTRFVMEIAASVEGCRFFRMEPGRLDDSLLLLEGVVP